MKYYFLLLIACICFHHHSLAQSLNINTAPDSLALLNAVSDSKGVLFPRLTAAERDAIVAPAEGLMIYCLSSHCLNIYFGGAWNELCGMQAPLSHTCGDTLIDLRDGKAYPTVQIGTQCWTAKNLEYEITGAIAGTGIYDPAITGLFYNWATMMQGSPSQDGVPGTVQGVCPLDWHIPTQSEWDLLETAVNGDGNALKAIGQGVASGEGTNTSGFSAILTGFATDTNNFVQGASIAPFWSATVAANPYYRYLAYNNGNFVEATSMLATFYFPVRCIKD